MAPLLALSGSAVSDVRKEILILCSTDSILVVRFGWCEGNVQQILSIPISERSESPSATIQCRGSLGEEFFHRPRLVSGQLTVYNVDAVTQSLSPQRPLSVRWATIRIVHAAQRWRLILIPNDPQALVNSQCSLGVRNPCE
jgi:hypothetical protein